MSAEFVLQKHKEGTFGFIYQTETGQRLLTSLAYPDADTARRRLDSARQMARKDRNYELRSADEGGFYFVVRNLAKEVLAFSQLYPDPESRQQGMTLTKGCSHGARVVDPFRALIKAQRRELFRKHSSHTLETPFSCPQCGSAMRPKTVKRGPHKGQTLWLCLEFPRCKGSLEYSPVPELESQPIQVPSL